MGGVSGFGTGGNKNTLASNIAAASRVEDGTTKIHGGQPKYVMANIHVLQSSKEFPPNSQ
jgi:hypothetical protein